MALLGVRSSSPTGRGDNIKNSVSCPDWCGACGGAAADNGPKTRDQGRIVTSNSHRLMSASCESGSQRAAPQDTDVDYARRLRRELEIAGGAVLLPETPGLAPSGVALSVDARRMLASEALLQQFRNHVLMLMANGMSVSITVEDPDRDVIQAQLEGICEALAAAARDIGDKPRSLYLVVDADMMSPQAAEAWYRGRPGSGRLFVHAGASQMTATGGCGSRDNVGEFWVQASRLHGRRYIQLVYASQVTSPCALLAGESADAVLPVTGTQVPVGSAWVPIRIDILRFADERGHINEQALERALHCAVDTGEALHEIVRWPTAQMRHDSWLNRRLAISIAGIGDLAIRRRLDPGRFSCLSNLDECLRAVRSTLIDRSRMIARQVGSLPALENTDRSLALPGGDAREAWRERWQRAIEIAAIRHRNLFVLSPWSLFPNSRPAEFHYTNLVPLLGLCDACTFDSPRSLAAWSDSELLSFHRHASAVLQHKGTAKQIAERV
jgi:hypothetical protein